MNRKRLWLSAAASSLLVAAALWATLAIAAPAPSPTSAPLFAGPAQGTSSAGVVRNTTSFSGPESDPPLEHRGQEIGPDYQIEPIELPGDMGTLSSPAASYTEVDDAPGAAPLQPSGATLASGFPGLADQVNAFGFSFIPPDPIMAAGPNHLMGLVNASFGIFAKSGTLQKKIDATVWFQNVLPGKIGDCQTTALGCLFDPKAFYDHFANRWVMVWLASDRSTESWILVSVSDDSDPHGAWCNWALDGDVNGSTAAQNWSDYQGLGFDNQAVYIVPNQFAFGGGFDYAKIRILPKSTLYNTSCPAITWTDMWDLRFPQAGADAFPIFTVRPAVTFGTPGIEYLVANSYFSPPNNNFMVLYSLTSPLSNPSLSAVAVPVAPTNPPPDANQPGGGTPLIDVGDDRVMNVVYRDGSLWAAHSVANSTGSFARARYLRIDAINGATIEDLSIGVANCWYYYPAISADVNSNMAMVFNRSCTTEFASIRYTTRMNGGPLSPSSQLKAGEANYVKTFGGSRNRWGDYNGIAVDPADPRRVWMFAEYAASPANTWGTWFGQVQFNIPPVADAQQAATTGGTPGSHYPHRLG